LTVQAPSEPPLTATGTTSRNVNGQAIAITVFSTLKWWGRFQLWFAFLIRRLRPDPRSPLIRLSFIHFARWTVIRRLPHNEGQPREKLRHSHLFFESNFNGGWEEYIDAFAHILTKGMTTLWGSSYGFPKPLPTAAFKDYIRRNEVEASHFYSAYPDATKSMVSAALDLDAQLAAFRERARDLDADQFAREWRRFLTDVQADL
jgi:hypothetical protein